MTRGSTTSVLLTLCVTAVFAGHPRPKKLIEYGWDVPRPEYVKEHIREMEKLPFDGLIMQLLSGGGGQVFIVKGKDLWDQTNLAKDLEALRQIEWRKFSDNFIAMYAASDMDWFSDGDWALVRRNVGLVAQAAKAGRCRGLCFDPEPYGDNPWNYPGQARAKEKSFSEYQAKVRQRGAEFMRAITEHLPRVVLHTFFQLSLFGDVMKEPDPERRDGLLAQHGYALLPAFLNGMLDAAGPGVTITDGNEPSYYYTNPRQYRDVCRMVKQRALTMIAPENVHKYRRQVQMSQALYVDYLFGLGVWGQRSSPAPALTPEERARWFEHNTYYALRSADEFVWLYSEKMNWWQNVDLPPGLETAVRSARTKVANQEPLGFEISGLLKAAQERRQAELRAKLITRTAEVQRLAAGDHPPVIDGKLDDAFWQRTKSLEPFVPYVAVEAQPKASTQAQVTYDDQNLFIAVRCAEPKKGEMKIVGERHDDSVWEGDSVDIFLSKGQTPTPYVHLILNPRNAQWDALFKKSNDLSFDPGWKSAVLVGDSDWTLEVALPWKELKMKPPTAGQSHRANVCRNRIPEAEQTSWSQMFGGFLESENFGTWVFR